MNLTDILNQHNIPYQNDGHNCRPGWIQFQCPYCGGGSDPRKLYMGYNEAGGYCNCWQCGHHRLGETLVRLTGMSWQKVKEISGDLDRYVGPAKMSGSLKIPKGVGPLLPPHKKYLRSRRYDPKTISSLWEVQAIGMSSRLSWRLFIPIRYMGRIVSWTTRSVALGGTARYISASTSEELIPHKSLLYGEDYVRHAALLVEGPFDVWRIGPGAVCSFGTAISRAQLLKLSKHAIRVICFDNEPEAQRQARKICDQLEPFPGKTYNVVLEAKDASESSDSEISHLRREFL